MIKEKIEFLEKNKGFTNILVLSMALITYSFGYGDYAIIILISFTNTILVNLYDKLNK